MTVTQQDTSVGSLADTIRDELTQLEREVNRLDPRDPAAEAVKTRVGSVRRWANHLSWQALPSETGNPELDKANAKYREAGFGPATTQPSDVVDAEFRRSGMTPEEAALLEGKTNPAQAPPVPEPKTPARDARHDGEPVPPSTNTPPGAAFYPKRK